MHHRSGTLCLVLLCVCAVAPSWMGGCPPEGENPPVGTVSDEDRSTSLEEIQAAVDSIGFDGDPAKTEQLAETMKAMSHFSQVEAGDGVVYARFTDGEFLVVMNNRPTSYDPDLEARVKAADPGAKRPSASPTSGAMLKDDFSPRSAEEKMTLAPESNKAILINAMGTDYCDLTPKLEKWLDGANYAVTKLDGTVESLRTGVKDAGVLYYSGHGAVVPPWAFSADVPPLVEGFERHFGLWTRTPCTLDNFPTYRQEVKNGYLIYGICPTDRIEGNLEDCEDREGAVQRSESHYVITEYFMDKYWRCSEGSLVYMDACHGSQSDSLMPTLFTQGDINASAFVGWSAGVLDRWSTPSAYYFFDRLLGANEFWPLFPAQRPYSLNTVLTKMAIVSRVGLPLPLSQSKSFKGLYLVDTSVPEYVADLVVDFADDVQDIMLRPAIRGLTMFEGAKRIVLEGDFGHIEGQVTMNGETLPLVGDGWTPGRIDCGISNDDASGRVVVELGELESNPRHLTKWDLTFHQLFMDFPTQLSTNCPSCFYEATMTFTIRGDVGGVRQNIDGGVGAPGFTSFPSQGELEVTNAGGTYSYGGGGTITLAPNADHGAQFIGTCIGFGPPSNNNYFGACFFMDGPNEQVLFGPTTLAEGLIRNYHGGPFDGTVDPYQVMYSGNLEDKRLTLPLTPNFTIPAGQQSTGDNSYFEWEAATPVHPTPIDDPR